MSIAPFPTDPLAVELPLTPRAPVPARELSLERKIELADTHITLVSAAAMALYRALESYGAALVLERREEEALAAVRAADKALHDATRAMFEAFDLAESEAA